MALLAVGGFVLVGSAAFLLTLSLPVEAWRTGEPPAPPLSLAPGERFATQPTRVWIDTDAACGHGQRTDPDDCFAILLLAETNGIEIVGISTVFGNAPLEVTDTTTRILTAEMARDGTASAPVYRGLSEPMDEDPAQNEAPAQQALREALKAGSLVIVALGPMTNIAAALTDRPTYKPM